MPAESIDWIAIGRLPHLALEGSDLDQLELVQLGLLEPWVEPATPGVGLRVLTDLRGTPLMLADPKAGRWELTLLRELDGLTPLTGRAATVVMVDGPFAGVPDIGGDDTVWIVPTRRDRQGSSLLGEVRALASARGGSVVRLPISEPRHDAVLRPRTLPSADDLAGRLGATEVLHLGVRSAEPEDFGRGGSVVLFTGLSGSGKSTLAGALHDELANRTTRELTLLDGDEMRRVLSAGLGFDAAGRSANVRRIGWVAALAARHGGIAIAAPIAPFAADRAEVRRMALGSGGFLLIWVATPFEVCEQRDRKGLYARARAGEVAEFTGISSPYEEPGDADIVIDTTTTDVDSAVAMIVAELDRRGHLVKE